MFFMARAAIITKDGKKFEGEGRGIAMLAIKSAITNASIEQDKNFVGDEDVASIEIVATPIAVDLSRMPTAEEVVASVERKLGGKIEPERRRMFVSVIDDTLREVRERSSHG